MMKALSACQGFIWMTAKKRADTTMAQPGFILVRSPRRTIPRHSHSSKMGAKMATSRKELQKGPVVILLRSSTVIS